MQSLLFKYPHFSKEKISLPFLSQTLPSIVSHFPFMPFPNYQTTNLLVLVYSFHPFCNRDWIGDHYGVLLFLTERLSSLKFWNPWVEFWVSHALFSLGFSFLRVGSRLKVREVRTPSFSLKWIVLIIVLECAEYVWLMIALNGDEFHIWVSIG